MSSDKQCYVMMREKFDRIYARAAERKGGDAALESLLSVALSSEQLQQIPDDRCSPHLAKKCFNLA